MTTGGRVVLAAHAKLTLRLRVVGVRADGYHLIDADMATLALHDTVTIDPAGHGVQIEGPFADGVPASDDNLVARALRLVGRSAGVAIDKQIPSGGGLGGGSARPPACHQPWRAVGRRGSCSATTTSLLRCPTRR
ncbi:MAG: hypothetical protein EBY98_00780 [Acidimicrobiia bacterium]|nr:hypothetical protein [Acidimicrobiia bacterium]